MDNKIVKVIFKEGWETMYNTDLTQEDYGQILQVEGVTLPDGNVEVHFSLTEHNGEAPISIGNVKDNVITVDIPDFILAKENEYNSSYEAYAWIYVTDGESGRTIRKIVFTIDTRAEPTSNVPEDQKDKFLQEVRQVMAETKEIAQSVRDDADNGKFSGIPGPPGKDGKDGENGKDGDDGEDGKSAYQYAVEGGFKGTEQEFIDLMAQAGQVDLTGYVSKEQHEEELLKTMVKVTTDKSPFHHITDSANMKVLDFGMEGITEQYTGTITDDEGNEVTVPNPTHPQEIKLAGVLNEETGRYEHKSVVRNKNFMSLVYDGSLSYDNGEFTVNYKNKTTDFIPFNVTETYYLSIGTNSYVALWGYDENKEFVARTPSAVITTARTFTKSSLTILQDGKTLDDIRYVRCVVPLVDGAYDDNIQFELGDTPTDFTPHQSQPFTLTSDRPLTMWDKLVKRDGVWGHSFCSKESVCNIDELSLFGNISDSSSARLYVQNAIFGSKKGNECRCEILRYSEGEKTNYYCGYWHNDMLCTRISNSVLEPYGYVYDETLSGLQNCSNAASAFKAMLKDKGHDTFHAWIEMSEEQAFIPLPEEEQTLLNNLETYYGVTNVYNEQGCPMWLCYTCDSKLYVDQKLLEIQQAII